MTRNSSALPAARSNRPETTAATAATVADRAPCRQLGAPPWSTVAARAGVMG
ncbi:hypothetical protein [Natrinema versiforme]|uniref:hypothetical protein n=1 Tax=Natrinema TaxID=88723 RepID=UPI001586EFD7|nr:hypothetical protein [Natrinema versiforme]